MTKTHKRPTHATLAHRQAVRDHKARLDWIMFGMIVAALAAIVEAIINCGILPTCPPNIEHTAHQIGLIGISISSLVAIFDHLHTGH